MQSSQPEISRSSLLFNILYSMVPLLGYWWVEESFGLGAGIVAAIVLGLGEVVWVYWKEHRLEPFSLWSAILVVVLGGLSWLMENDVMIKLKPAVLEGVFAGIFIVSSVLGKPFMVVLAQKQFKGMIQHPFQLIYLSGLNLRLGFLFLLHTFVTIYAAIWLSSAAWIFVKGVLFYLLFAVFFGIEFFYSRWQVKQYTQTQMHQQAFLEYQRNLIQQMRQARAPSSINPEKKP